MEKKKERKLAPSSVLGAWAERGHRLVSPTIGYVRFEHSESSGHIKSRIIDSYITYSEMTEKMHALLDIAAATSEALSKEVEKWLKEKEQADE